MSRGKLYNVFQDRSTFKNAVFVFVIVSLEQVVSRLGITCKNATLWLIVPPCVILIVSCLKSKNVTLLLNCNTSKNCSLGLEFVAQGYVALMYMSLPALTWIVAAFLDTKIWVCHRMGFENCEVAMNCTLDEVRRRDEERRTLKAESQNIALLILTVSVMCTALLSCGYHLLFARPDKEHELEDLARDAARTVLENYAAERASQRLQQIRTMVMAKTKDKAVEAELAETRVERAQEERVSYPGSEGSLNNYQLESKWFEQLDRNIILYLEDHLITDHVKLIYPET